MKPSINLKRKLLIFLIIFELSLFALIARVFYLQAAEGAFLQKKAFEQQTRDRLITPQRGTIYDRNMIGIAQTETVSSVSVIHNQIKNEEETARVLSEKLGLEYDKVLQKVSKRVALERIKTKVEKTLADEIRDMNMSGVVVDEDIKRVYPYSTMASQVIGFVGKDNQGIIGLEAKYDSFLKGSSGKILTETDVYGRPVKGSREYRQEPTPGENLVISIDVILQQYAEQALEKVVSAKDAKRGAIIIMNPQNGEIYAMANKPDFDLNDPFTINSLDSSIWSAFSEKERNDKLNQMWRNFAINDTYEPGSTFKVITSAAGLEEGVVNLASTFVCGGSREVAGRLIKCWRSPLSHGAENFVQGVQNSCNPVFMDVAERLGAEKFYNFMLKLGFNEKTGIDLPGEAVGILHKLKNIGPVELATMSFGQSFQITPLQLLRGSAATVNGGYLVTPHFGLKTVDEKGNTIREFNYEKGEQVLSQKTSEEMKYILESVVFAGTGNKTYIAGYRVGGKTATSEKLPRRSGKYIASFLALAPAENPQVMALVLIDEPQGTYYGGQVAGPVMKEILENTLPYLNVDIAYKDDELKLDEAIDVDVPSFFDSKLSDAKKLAKEAGVNVDAIGEGTEVYNQFPLPGEKVKKGAKVILYVYNKG